MYCLGVSWSDKCAPSSWLWLRSDLGVDFDSFGETVLGERNWWNLDTTSSVLCWILECVLKKEKDMDPVISLPFHWNLWTCKIILVLHVGLDCLRLYESDWKLETSCFIVVIPKTIGQDTKLRPSAREEPLPLWVVKGVERLSESGPGAKRSLLLSVDTPFIGSRKLITIFYMVECMSLVSCPWNYSNSSNVTS